MKKWLALGLALATSYGHSQRVDTLQLSTYTYATNTRLSSLECLANYLTKQTQVPIKIKSYGTVRALVASIQQGESDLSMINTLGYVTLRSEASGNYEVVATLQIGDGKQTDYGSCLITHSASAITSVEQLETAGRLSLSFVSPMSTSGNLVPRLLLSQHNIPDPESRFEIRYAGTHRKVLEEVAGGHVDLGGCGCDELQKDSTLSQQVRVLARFNNIPPGPVVFQKTLPLDTRRALTRALTKMSRKDSQALECFCKGWTEFVGAEAFQKIDEGYYDEFLHLFQVNPQLLKLLPQ